MAVSDEDLLDAWRRGDLGAGEQLFDRYYESILRFFRSKISGDVADLVQQTFIACVEGRDRVRKSSSFRNYLFAAAHNVFRAHLRVQYRHVGEVDCETTSLEDLAPGPSSVFARRREERLLLEALRNIPIDYQLVIELRYWEQLKTIEISEILGVPHGTVRSRLRLANDVLRKTLRRLATSPRELASTLHDLDDWARACRERVGTDRGETGDDSDDEESSIAGSSSATAKLAAAQL